MVIDFQRKVLKSCSLVHLHGRSEQNRCRQYEFENLKKQQCPSGLIFEGSDSDHVLCNIPRSGFTIILLFLGATFNSKGQLEKNKKLEILSRSWKARAEVGK